MSGVIGKRSDAPTTHAALTGLGVLSSEGSKPADQVCIACARPFVFGPKSDPRATVYTAEGKHEIAISGMCERCFDDCTEERDEGES